MSKAIKSYEITKVPRAPFAIANLLMATVVFVIGVGVVVSAGYLNTDRFLSSKGLLRDYADPIVTAMLVGGLMCIIISLLGCAVIRVENIVLPRCYGIFLIPSFIIFLVCTVQLGALVNTGNKGLQSLCND